MNTPYVMSHFGQSCRSSSLVAVSSVRRLSGKPSSKACYWSVRIWDPTQALTENKIDLVLKGQFHETYTYRLSFKWNSLTRQSLTGN